MSILGVMSGGVYTHLQTHFGEKPAVAFELLESHASAFRRRVKQIEAATCWHMLSQPEVERTARFIEEVVLTSSEPYFKKSLEGAARTLFYNPGDAIYLVNKGKADGLLDVSCSCKRVSSAVRIPLDAQKSCQQVVQGVNRNFVSAYVLTVREIALLKKLSGVASIVQMAASFIYRPAKAAIFLEYCPTDLQKMTAANEELNIRQFARDLVAAVRHLHDMGIIHGDLKINNVLVDGKEKRPRLADFGLSFSLHAPGEQVPFLEYGYGTLMHAAPELLVRGPNQCDYKKAEVWALGMLLYIAYKKLYPPWAPLILAYNKKVSGVTLKVLYDKIVTSIRHESFRKIDDPMLRIISCMMDPNPNCRPDMAECQQLLAEPDAIDAAFCSRLKLVSKCFSDDECLLISQFARRTLAMSDKSYFIAYECGLTRDLQYDRSYIYMRTGDVKSKGTYKRVHKGIGFPIDREKSALAVAISVNRIYRKQVGIDLAAIQESLLFFQKEVTLQRELFALEPKGKGIWPILHSTAYQKEVSIDELVESVPKLSVVSPWGVPLNSMQNVTPQMVVQIVHQLLIGLIKLHDRNEIHGDLKAQNVLVDPGSLFTGLNDFGLAFKEGEKNLPGAFSVGFYGTYYPTAPELFGSTNFTGSYQKAEMWALGYMLYEFVYGIKPPWKDIITPYCSGTMRPATVEDTARYNVALVAHLELPTIIDQFNSISLNSKPTLEHSLKGLVRKLLSIAPQDRPSAKEALAIVERLFSK